MVHEAIVQPLDHRLVVSKAFIHAHSYLTKLNNLMIWEMEPSAENMLVYI